jgi:hypothetical protein
MARLVIPIALTFMGGGMPWTLQGELTTEWTAATVNQTYVEMYYWLDDYVEDEEWTITPEPSDTWTLVA